MNVGVTAGTGCTWSASTSVGWLSASPASGSGNGTVTLTATATTSAVTSRTTTATIAGQTVTVTQAAGTATFSLSPTTWSAPAEGGTQPITLTASYADAAWTAASDQPWLTLSASNGMGSSAVTLTAPANPSAVNARTATATIAGQIVTVTQAAGTATFSVTPTIWAAPAVGGAQTVTVGATPGDAAWTASTNQPWLTLGTSSGTGSGAVMLTASANPSAVTSRTATATVAGQSVTVTQPAGTATFSISTMAWAAPAAGGTQGVTVTASLSDGVWSASSSAAWLTLSTASGTGNGTVTLTAAATTSALTRTATATIAGQIVTVTQAAGTPVFALSATSWAPTALGGTQTVAVTSTLADAMWPATSTASWLTLSVSSGTGSGAVILTAATNQTSTSRTAAANIAGRTVTVTQTAADRPLGLRVVSITGSAVTLQWRWPGTAPDSYVLKGGLAQGQTIATLPIAGRAPMFTFDAPAGVFYVRIAGVRGGTDLPVSDDVRIVVNVPERPSAPTQLLGLANGSGLALSWTNTADGGAATGLVLDVTGAISTALPLAMTDQFSFNGVPPGTYTFRVRATNAEGSSAASNAVTLAFPGACQAPAVPQDLEAFVVGSVVNIRWNAPATGGAATSYVLTVGGAVSMALPVAGRSLSSQAPSGTYTFTVAAQNACGTSPSTSAQSVTVP